MARLVLVGLPGVGKTSLALALGARWGCDVVDTDESVATRVGMSAAAYLREKGEPEFRRCELEALESAIARDVVVATGGGIVTTAEARTLLRDQPTVWMDCSDEVILARIGDEDRPLLTNDHAGSLARLRGERAQWYRDVARARIDAGDSIDVVARRVTEALEREHS